MSTISKLWEKLSNPEYRRAYVASQINIGIPAQLKALLKSRGWTQRKLADEAGMLQPRISGLLTPGRTSPNIKTLRRIAEAFDCALIVRFVPFSELARWSEHFDPEAFHVAAFDEDAGFIERKPVLAATRRREWFQATGTLDARTVRTEGGSRSFAIADSAGAVKVVSIQSALSQQLDYGTGASRQVDE